MSAEAPEGGRGRDPRFGACGDRGTQVPRVPGLRELNLSPTLFISIVALGGLVTPALTAAAHTTMAETGWPRPAATFMAAGSLTVDRGQGHAASQWQNGKASLEGGTTRLVSVNPKGRRGNGSSFGTALSASGRFLVFESQASDLVQGDTNEVSDVFVRDLKRGKTERVSLNSRGKQGNDTSNVNVSGNGISADGRYVVFTSRASNLVKGDTNRRADVFVHDRTTGRTSRVSVSSSGKQDSRKSLDGVISGNGRFVAFTSLGHFGTADRSGQPDVFVHDRRTGATTLESVDSMGRQGRSGSREPGLSFDGRKVVFTSFDRLVPNDSNRASDVYLRDLDSASTDLVSVTVSGTAPRGVPAYSEYPSISADGRLIAFSSFANGLVNGSDARADDVYVRDMVAGRTQLISTSRTGARSNGVSQFPALSPNGLWVVYVSTATNLTSAKARGAQVYRHDRTTGMTTLESVNTAGIPAKGGAGPFPAVVANGRLAFSSSAPNLAPRPRRGGASGFPGFDVYLRLSDGR